MDTRALCGIAAVSGLFLLSSPAGAVCMKNPQPAENRDGAIGQALNDRGQDANRGGAEHPCLQTEKPDPVPGVPVKKIPPVHQVPPMHVPPADPPAPPPVVFCAKAPNNPRCR